MPLQLFLAAMQAVGLIAICTIAYGWIQRSIRQKHLRGAAIGCLLGLGSMLSMLHPFLAVDGFQVDSRNMFLAIATTFGGALSTFIALTIAATARLMIGGGGAMLGLAIMALVSIMAAAWSYLTRKEKKRSVATWFILGSILCTPMLVTLAIMDKSIPSVALTRVITDMVGAMVFGKLFEGEQRRARRERQLNHDANTDPLTGLPNRRAFMNFVDHLNPAAPGYFALLIIDADHFKAINDTHGHDAGDRVLSSLAQTLSSSLRKDDFVARLGGEEFAVLLHVSEPDSGRELAERLRLNLSGQHLIKGSQVMVTVSIGGCVLPAQKFNFDDAYVQSDAALYTAKRLGRDRAVFARQDCQSPASAAMVGNFASAV